MKSLNSNSIFFCYILSKHTESDNFIDFFFWVLSAKSFFFFFKKSSGNILVYGDLQHSAFSWHSHKSKSHNFCSHNIHCKHALFSQARNFPTKWQGRLQKKNKWEKWLAYILAENDLGLLTHWIRRNDVRMGQGGRGKKNKKMGFWNINANFLIKNSLGCSTKAP